MPTVDDWVVILEANQPELWACPGPILDQTKTGMVTVRRHEGSDTCF